jgi:hypothetical protein
MEHTRLPLGTLASEKEKRGGEKKASEDFNCNLGGKQFANFLDKK